MKAKDEKENIAPPNVVEIRRKTTTDAEIESKLRNILQDATNSFN